MKTKKIVLGEFIEPPGAVHMGVLDSSALQSVWDVVGRCYGYLKSDGWRIQLHARDGQINLYSRKGNDESISEFSVLAQRLQEELGQGEFLLDTEVVGLDRNGMPTPLRRIRDAAKHVAVVLDALRINGEDLTEVRTDGRQKKMHSLLGRYVGNSLMMAEYKHINSFLDLEAIYQNFLDKKGLGYDGVILKKYESNYFTKAIKVKSEINIDAVVIGVSLSDKDKIEANQPITKEWANSLLLAVMDRQTAQWIPIGKVSGDDEDWVNVCAMCKARVASKGHTMNILPPPDPPDLWVRPEIVVQITARTISLGAKDSYIVVAEAPRDIFLRRDKKPELATTFDELLEIGGIKERPIIPLMLF